MITLIDIIHIWNVYLILDISMPVSRKVNTNCIYNLLCTYFPQKSSCVWWITSLFYEYDIFVFKPCSVIVNHDPEEPKSGLFVDLNKYLLLIYIIFKNINTLIFILSTIDVFYIFMHIYIPTSTVFSSSILSLIVWNDFDDITVRSQNRCSLWAQDPL